MTVPPAALLTVAEGAALLRSGYVLAYPTEAVFGLGCDPWSEAAVGEILRLKGRSAAKGLIAIAAEAAQVRAWVDCDRLAWQRACRSWPGPVTWVFAAAEAPRWLCRDDGSIAVRVTAHPPAAGLANAFGGPVVSTSANPSGHPPARTHALLQRYFGAELPILEGSPGALGGPTEIRDAASGRTLRS